MLACVAHRMVGVGRDLCGTSNPIRRPKQGHLQQAAQDLVQAGLEYLQRRRIHHLPGQPVPVLRHPQREEVVLAGFLKVARLKPSPRNLAYQNGVPKEIKFVSCRYYRDFKRAKQIVVGKFA